MKYKLNSDGMLAALMNWVDNGSDILIPNYYLDWYECDLFRINRDLQLFEYEIKVSRQDYLKDFEKGHSLFDRTTNTERFKSKHDVIVEGKRVNRFYYVTPEGLLKPNEVPAGFGLIVAKIWYQERIQFKIEKASKRFSNENLCTKELLVKAGRNLTLKLAHQKLRTRQADANYRNTLKQIENS